VEVAQAQTALQEKTTVLEQRADGKKRVIKSGESKETSRTFQRHPIPTDGSRWSIHVQTPLEVMEAVESVRFTSITCGDRKGLVLEDQTLNDEMCSFEP
jgi:hypothetical protein